MYLKKFQLTLLLGTLSFAQISTSNPQTSDVVADYQRVIKEQSARPSNGSFSAPHKITGKELRTTSVYEFVTLINSKVRGIYLLPPDMLKEADKKF